jgi:hypothetical protein
MRSSLTIGGIEVELSVGAASLEGVIARRYAPFLGPPVNPVSTVCFELASPREQIPLHAVAVVTDRGDVALGRSDLPAGVEFGSLIRIRTTATPRNIDRALQTVFSMLASSFDGLLFSGCGVILDRSAHVLAGGSDIWRSTLAGRAGRRPLLLGSCVMVHQVDGRWIAAATPFSAEAVSPPRQAPLSQLWVPAPGPFTRRSSAGNLAAALALDAAMPPTQDPGVRQLASNVFNRLLAAVPLDALPSLSPARIWEEIISHNGSAWRDESEFDPRAVA